MKHLVFFLLFFYVLYNTGCKKDASSPTQSNVTTTELEGKWNGTQTGGDAYSFTFTVTTFEIENTLKTKWSKGTYTANSAINPKQIDLKIVESNDSSTMGKTMQGIYKIESGQMTLVLDEVGDSLRPVGFADSLTRAFVLILEKRQVPDAPTLAIPENNAVLVPLPVNLSWNKSSGAVSYRLQVSDNASFSTTIFDDSTLTAQTGRFTNLTKNTKYYWRVNAKNVFGTSGWPNTVWSFTTASGDTTGTPCAEIPTVLYEGKTYHTVQIGSQCWLKENLDVGTMVISNTEADTMRNNGIIEKYCFNNDSLNCSAYGGLYKWAEAVQYKNRASDTSSPFPSFSGNIQGICPADWHVPSLAEIKYLDTIISHNTNLLKGMGYGSGIGAGKDSTGFSALLSGFRSYSGTYGSLGYSAYFWSSTQFSAGFANFMGLLNDDDSMYLNNFGKKYGFGVRCIKN